MELSKLDPMLTAAFIAISGHMGTRLIFLAEEQLIKRFGLDTNANYQLTMRIKIMAVILTRIRDSKDPISKISTDAKRLKYFKED